MKTGVASWSRRDALSELAWLIDAGVDTVVADEAGVWLRAVEMPPAESALAAPERLDIPASSQPSAPPVSTAGTALPPLVEGPASAAIMLVMEADPRAAGRILAPAEQLLLGRMMAAIGLDLEQLARIGLRGPGQPMLAGQQATLALLLGDGPTRAMLDRPVAAARGTAHSLAIDGRQVTAFATLSPQFLISQPRMKAHAWADLRLFAQSLRPTGGQ